MQTSIGVLSQLIIDYVEYSDMMSFLLAFLSSKCGALPAYRMRQVKRRFLKKIICEDGYVCYLPNNTIEGHYKYTHNKIVYEGVFIDSQRYCKTDKKGIYNLIGLTHIDYDLSCRDKPFGYYKDQYTGVVNRFVCRRLHGYAHTIIGDKMVKGYYGPYGRVSYVLASHTSIEFHYAYEGIFYSYMYDLNLILDRMESRDELNVLHGVCIDFNDSRVESITEYHHGVCLRKESYLKRINGLPSRICVETESPYSSITFKYRDGVGYVGPGGEELDEELYINTLNIDHIRHQGKIDPSLMPTTVEIELLKKLHKKQ
jgi:hypothetical protein